MAKTELESGRRHLAMKMETPGSNTLVWFQNRFVPLAEANVSILTHALHYGTGVFEGIRGYYEESRRELFLFRMPEHYDRWKRNCGILRIDVPLSPGDLCGSRRNSAGAITSGRVCMYGRLRT